MGGDHAPQEIVAGALASLDALEDDELVLVGDEASWSDPTLPAGDPSEIANRLPGRMKGWLHVVEFDGWDKPTEIARYKVADFGTHNYWVDPDEEVLYVAFYQGGLRVLDISGELVGDLYAQGREIGRFYADDPGGYIPNSPMAWGPQVHKGTIFFSDFHSGLWAVKLLAREEDKEEIPTGM